MRGFEYVGFLRRFRKHEGLGSSLSRQWSVAPVWDAARGFMLNGNDPKLLNLKNRPKPFGVASRLKVPESLTTTLRVRLEDP